MGKGKIRIIGGALTTPIEEKRPPLRAARLCDDLQRRCILLENSIEYDQPDLGNVAAAAGHAADADRALGRARATTRTRRRSRRGWRDVEGNAAERRGRDVRPGERRRVRSTRGPARPARPAWSTVAGAAAGAARVVHARRALRGGRGHVPSGGRPRQPFTVTREDVAMTLQRTGSGRRARVWWRGFSTPTAPGEAVSQRIVQFTAERLERAGGRRDGWRRLRGRGDPGRVPWW